MDKYIAIAHMSRDEYSPENIICALYNVPASGRCMKVS